MGIAIYGMCLENKTLISKSVIDEGKRNIIDLSNNFSGKMYNVCNNLVKLDNEVHFITKFGNDNIAFDIETSLNRNLIFTYPIYVDEKTPTAFHINDLEKQLYLETNTKNFDFSEKDKTFHAGLCNCNYGLIDTNNTKYIKNIYAHSSHIKWILTQSITDESILANTYGMIINRKTMLQLTAKNQSIDHCAKSLILKGLNFIIITLDKEGCVYFDKKNSWHFPLNCDKVQTTIGVDESFIAGFTSQLSKNNDIKVAIKKGLQLALLTLTNKSL